MIMTVETHAPHVLSCFHCGDLCPSADIESDGRFFCCSGCLTVYEILREQNLDTYYLLEEKPGTSRKESRAAEGRFAYLDDEILQKEFLQSMGVGRCQVVLRLPQIHCASCVWLLERFDQLEEGVLRAQVDLLRRELTVDFASEHTSLRRVVERLASIGYEPEITLADGVGKKRGFDPLVGRLAVAGFCFGNIMLFSLPSYLAVEGELTAKWSAFFAWLGAFLALPVVLYSAVDFWKSAWHSVRHGAVTIDVPIALGIAALFARSSYEIISGSGSGYMDSLAGLVFFLLLGRVFQRRTFAQLSFDRDYRSYFPLAATLLEGGQERSVTLRSLGAGQRIVVRYGELVPADSSLVSERAILDYSYATGESEPIEKKRGDMLEAGGRIVGAAAELEVMRPVSQSYLTRLWNRSAFREGEAGRALVDVFSKYFTLGVIAVAVLAALYWWPRDAALAVHAFTSVLIVACPCALALATPFTTGTALNVLAASGLYLRSADRVEHLAQIDGVVFDKTGTLTNARGNEVHCEGLDMAPREKALLAELLRNSAHPLSREVDSALAATATGVVVGYEERVGRGLRGIVDGRSFVVGSGAWLKENGIEVGRQMATRRTVVHVAIDGAYRGRFVFIASYRQGIEDMLRNLAQRFPLFLLSGDNDRERERLASFFANEHLHFAQSPQDKLNYIEQLESAGWKTLMVGDGLNDAGALKRSSVGLAVSQQAGAFAPACDGIIDADQLAQLPIFLRFARWSRRVVIAGMALSLLYNLVGLSFAVQGMLSPLLSALLMPVSSLSVVVLTVGATHVLARYLDLGD
jgi:Cu+-exporting ATPase